MLKISELAPKRSYSGEENGPILHPLFCPVKLLGGGTPAVTKGTALGTQPDAPAISHPPRPLCVCGGVVVVQDQAPGTAWGGRQFGRGGGITQAELGRWDGGATEFLELRVTHRSRPGVTGATAVPESSCWLRPLGASQRRETNRRAPSPRHRGQVWDGPRRTPDLPPNCRGPAAHPPPPRHRYFGDARGTV